LLILLRLFHFFFFNDTPPTDIYTLSLHDALPISRLVLRNSPSSASLGANATECNSRCSLPNFSPAALNTFAMSSSHVTSHGIRRDRKSTRLNSSHLGISYAVFCLKKKKKIKKKKT